ncbi:hypothetical protein BFJ71_g1764 [Fusarium oxysporum]|nr:hypothetical protein BFJ71_g1764 [Fusarium oxysporum]
MRFGIGQYTHQRHMFAPYNESQTEDIPSKRESESWGEGSTKKLKTERHQSIPAATTFNEQEKDGTKEKKHDYMTHHIAAHLQTLMFLTLRVILMQQGVGSEEEDAAESNAGTNGIQNYQGPHRLGDPPSFEDENYQSELPWLPAAEPYSFDFDPLQHKVFRYPIFGREDIIDTSIQNPDSFTVQETIVHLEALLATIEPNRGFYNSLIGVLESVRHRNPPRSSYYSGSRSVSQWQCQWLAKRCC